MFLQYPVLSSRYTFRGVSPGALDIFDCNATL